MRCLVGNICTSVCVEYAMHIAIESSEAGELVGASSPHCGFVSGICTCAFSCLCVNVI